MFAGVLLLQAAYLIIMGVMLFLTGFGPYRMAQHAGIPNPWLAFLPIADFYIIGLLAERSYYAYNGREKRLANWSVLLILGPIGMAFLYSLVVGFFPGAILEGPAVWLFALLFIVPIISALILQVYCQYYIFRDYSPNNAVLYIVLTIVFNIGFVFLLIERDTVPVSVTGFGAYPYGRPKYDRWHRWNQVPPQDYYRG